MTDLVIRALTEADAHLFNSLADPGLVGRALMGVEYRTRASGGDYLPEWTYVALRDGKVVARAAFWGSPQDTEPLNLNWFDFADGEHDAAVTLLREAPFDVEYELILPSDWRERPEAHTAAQARISAAAAAGKRPLVERLRYTWNPQCGLPARPGRLEFREEHDEAALLDALCRIHSDTLDAHAQRAKEQGGAEQAAREELEYIQWCPEAWPQLAFTPQGELVGLHLPCRIPSGFAAGFIGVVPEQRGHGYAYDLLVESTHFLSERGAERIVAATDVGNFPMAANFAKAGYPVVQMRIDLV
ncbi:GNAT family N-acetyltransferase [Streptomyces cavernicola]|uniref:GNAT family N-acetyltransferase n=1 Tax=Streptomyces cavernicola TaxID=3043613 RepID=A0ABT6S2N4_9ACTN|nr:GNAT family N-acetyltransferase [Streptomyces sp. B-S-A6]MDI3402285.1 GNAT family N-acetyltransferase [Streptomyces sp. B-S-A6]